MCKGTNYFHFSIFQFYLKQGFQPSTTASEIHFFVLAFFAPHTKLEKHKKNRIIFNLSVIVITMNNKQQPPLVALIKTNIVQVERNF